MLNLSVAGMLEKSQLSSEGVWLLLVEVAVPDSEEPLRLVRNNEDIVWNGYAWSAFNFTIDEVKEDYKARMTSIALQISNITQTVQAYVENNNGLVGANVVLRVIHSQHLDTVLPEVEEIFTIQATTCDSKWVTFDLGCDMLEQLRFPFRRVLKSFCAWRDHYKGIECGYAGELPSCDGTLQSCRDRDNSVRYGGEPSIPEGGLYA
jgi:lambda family phage minor tail protein L